MLGKTNPIGNTVKQLTSGLLFKNVFIFLSTRSQNVDPTDNYLSKIVKIIHTQIHILK